MCSSVPTAVGSGGSPVPRAVLRAGAQTLRRWRPELASVFGIALVRDLEGERVPPAALRRLGIEPRPMSEHITQMAQAARGAASQAAGPGSPAGGPPISL